MKNVIIGLAFNYSDKQIAPFLNSLNQTGFTGDLVLYINNKSSIAPKASYGYNVILKNFQKDHALLILKYRLLKLIPASFIKKYIRKRSLAAADITGKSQAFPEDTLAFFYVNFYLATMRFILYYNFLLSNRYDNVFFSDVSDVVFQQDIFKSVTASKIMAFEEKKDISIAADEYNSKWVIECCGSEAFEKIKDKNIYCSGTILGDYNASMAFLKDYIEVMISREFKRKIVGLDQGFYNYMINYLKLPYFIRSENADVVFTVALNSPDDFMFIGDKVFYKDKQDKMPSIIHQYTRHPDISAKIKAIYAG